MVTNANALPEGTGTVLSTDVLGSTALAAIAGDAATRDRMRAGEERTRAVGVWADGRLAVARVLRVGDA